jgi:hypothetical protein
MHRSRLAPVATHIHVPNNAGIKTGDVVAPLCTNTVRLVELSLVVFRNVFNTWAKGYV